MITAEVANIILTIILTGVYLYNTRVQNNKIKTQSDIINDLKDHVKFFDIQKIKEYVELRETEKDKLLNLTKSTIEKELQLKYSHSTTESKKANEIATDSILEIIKEPYTYIVLDLLMKSDDEALMLINQYFPKNKEKVMEAYQSMKLMLVEQYGTSDLRKLSKSMK